MQSLAALERLCADVASLAQRRGDADVARIVLDSRAARPGDLFAAVPGSSGDGHDHAADAVRRGAAALLVSRWVDQPVPQLRVPRVRAVLGPLSAALTGDPGSRLRLAAVTGTNGKTTTCWLLRSALGSGGVPAGTVGTLGVRLGGPAGDRVLPSTATTPEAPELYQALADLGAAGAQAVVVETSSIGLDLGRLDGLRFELAVHTGLEEEHMDHHGTMEQYYASKALLFEPDRAERAVMRVDDPWGVRLAAQARIPVLTFGSSHDADVVLTDVRSGRWGTSVVLTGRDGPVRLQSELVGRVNAANLAAAYLAARSLGVDRAAAVEGLRAQPPLQGRHVLLEEPGAPLVVIDYAHTPRAVSSLVQTGRDLAAPGGRVSVVFGARGDRARRKRPEIAAAAAQADRVVLTGDSTQSESLDAALAEYRLGLLASSTPFVVEPDRREGLRAAIGAAGPGDVVLVAGRGHERALLHQGGGVEEFDDAQVATDLLRERARDSFPYARSA